MIPVNARNKFVSKTLLIAPLHSVAMRFAHA